MDNLKNSSMLLKEKSNYNFRMYLINTFHTNLELNIAAQRNAFVLTINASTDSIACNIDHYDTKYK